MNLSNYIPHREAFIHYMDYDYIPILGISNFRIDIDRLQAHYSVWVETDSEAVQFIVGPNSSFDAIVMTPENINIDASLIIDGFSITCNIIKYAYNSNKHAYIFDLTFNLDKNNVRTYIFERVNNKKKETRFDLLDFS